MPHTSDDHPLDAFPFVKGHGTHNDFVLLPDADGRLHDRRDGDGFARLVAGLCHRRAGIGGDGVIRVVRTGACDDPAAVALRAEADWFMDYRNADGSLSEMCGNGVRVFARYLVEDEGVDPSRPLPVATRAGLRTVTVDPRGTYSVDMGPPALLGETSVAVGDRTWPAMHVSMGNPHAVVFVESLEQAGSLREAPGHDRAAFPDGVNVEFVVRRGDRHVAMRVHERGSGETQSCGTGACAAMVAAAAANGAGRGTTYRVDVPGGELHVAWTAEDRVVLTGPAVLVARGTVAVGGLDGAG